MLFMVDVETHLDELTHPAHIKKCVSLSINASLPEEVGWTIPRFSIDCICDFRLEA